MTFDIDKYEEECNRIEKENEKYLELFKSSLVDAGLTEKTIKQHIFNVEFYINTFLLYGDPLQMEEGCFRLDPFLGDYFIRKAMWSTPANIKTTAASIKKFYKCMCEHNIIDKCSYDFLCSDIKENMSFWQEECEEFNNF